jgi:CDP-ribitol ribitolphosphotransferase
VPERPEARAQRQPPAVDILSLEWTRVQVTITVRPVSGPPLDPAAFRLERGGSSRPAMAPTHGEARDGGLALRFNVMQGPGQVPLEPGDWRLVLATPGRRHGTPVVVADQGPLDPARDAAAFTVARGEYRVVPRVDPGSRSLTLAIRLEPPDRSEREPSPPGARLCQSVLRRLQRGRPILFEASLRIARIAARRNGRRILFTSDSRSELGGNLQLVHDRMVERGLDRDHELLTLFKPGITTRRSFRDRFRLPWLLARADTIVIDDYQPVIYRVNIPDVRIVQLWHAVGAFKTVGYSRVGKPGAPNPYGRIHKNYSWVTVSSHTDVPVYAEAFGIPEERVVATGIPRTDRFFDPAYGQAAQALAREAFPETRGRTTILFAPTFRGHGAKTATYDFERLDYAALHALCVEKDAVCIVRMHPFVRDPLGIPEAFGDRLLDGQRSSIDVNDLLFAVDLLITDYSSIVYEFSTLGRPMLFYAYDLDEYVAGRDFYEPYEDFVPGRIVRTFAELIDAIRRDDCQAEKVVPFADRHFDHRDAGSTDRVVDLIVGE